MFTGLINGVATIVAIKKNKSIFSYTANFPFFLCNTLKVGASVAYNGCCLTIKYIDNFKITCDVIEETLRITNLGQLNIGDRVNIERSAKYGDEIGGHIVSGHIMNTVIVSTIVKSDKNYTLWLKVNNIELMKYIFYKGFICIDGVSLTIGEILKDEFCVHLIPQTLLDTTIGERRKNDIMNIEIDHHTQIVVDTTERVIRRKIEIT